MFKPAVVRWTARSADAATHLLLDGGKLQVPADQEAELLALVARCHLKRDRACLIEKRTPTFKLHADLDFSFDSEAADDAVEAAATQAASDATQAAVKFFDVQVASAIVCWSAAGPKPHKGLRKLGVHLIFEDVFAEAPVALGFRNYCLETGWSAAGLACTPQDAFDAAVYTANGLRACYCQKGSTAALDDVYVPRLAITAGTDGEPTIVRLPPISAFAEIRRWLGRTSIRAHGADATPVRRSVLEAMGADVDAWAAENHASCVVGRRGQLASVPDDVLAAIDDALPPQFIGQRFSALMTSLDGAAVFFRSTSRHCLNIGRQHNSNNVYFILTRMGLAQKCFCRCETTEGRKHGLCREFRSDIIRMPDPVIRHFFTLTELEDTMLSAVGMPGLSAAAAPEDARSDLMSVLGQMQAGGAHSAAGRGRGGRGGRGRGAGRRSAGVKKAVKNKK